MKQDPVSNPVIGAATREELDLIMKRQALTIDIQASMLKQLKLLTISYILIFLIGISVALILLSNKVTSTSNGEKLDRMIEELQKQNRRDDE